MKHSFIITLAVMLWLGSQATAQQIPTQTFTKSVDRSGSVVQDPDTPVSFRLPPGWTMTSVSRWGEHETTLTFKERGTGISAALYYQHPYQPPRQQDTVTALRIGMGNKVILRHSEGFVEYTVRPNTIQKRRVGDLPAISFMAEYTHGERPMVEYMVRVIANSTKAHFFVTLPPDVDLDAFVKRFDAIVETLENR